MAKKQSKRRPVHPDGDAAILEGSWRSVAADYLRSARGVPDDEISRLLADCGQGLGIEEWQHVADEWDRAQEARQAAEADRRYFEKTRQKPAKPRRISTVAELRDVIRETQREWLSESQFDKANIFSARTRLCILWDIARTIDGAPPVPPMTPPLPGLISDMQEALAAADVLLRWCEQASPPPLPMAQGKPQADLSDTSHSGDEKPLISKEATALAVLKDHPDWSDAKIAQAAGCSRTTLYTWQSYVKSRAIIAEPKSSRPRGSKSKEGHIEAWADGDNE